MPWRVKRCGETYNLTTVLHLFSALQHASFAPTFTPYAMKFQPEKSERQAINAYGPGWVSVDGEKVYSSVVIGSKGQRFAWECARFDDLSAAHFDRLAELAPELVIFGSGDRIKFPKAPWLAGLYARRIGLETMDTQAACRTYNILAGEGRDVMLAILIESAPA